MNYNILPEPLRSTADVVYTYLNRDMGLNRINIEKSLDPSLGLRPTFSVRTRDAYMLCVEVSERISTPVVMPFVSHCKINCIPIKFFIALPSIKYPDFGSELKQARDDGVGILEVNTLNHSCDTICSALLFSLVGLRKFNRRDFPKKYRLIVADAENLFRNGSPNEACSMIYDEIESLTRKIVIQAHQKGYVRTNIQNPSNLNVMQWDNIITQLRNNIDNTRNSPYAVIRPRLISKIHGIIDHRNQSGHKPKDLQTQIIRDTQLRTRMESAVDLLLDLVTTIHPLRIK